MVPSEETAYAVPGRRSSGCDGLRGSAATPTLPRSSTAIEVRPSGQTRKLLSYG